MSPQGSADMEEKEVWERLTRAEQSIKSAHHRIDSIEKLTQSVSDMVIEVKHMREDMNEMRTELDEVKNRPVTIWNKLLWALTGSVVSGTVAAIFSFFE